MKKRKRKKRIGISLAVMGLSLLIPAAAAAKKKPAAETYAIVSGTVFDDRGYALQGANVILAPEGSSGKTKPIDVVSSARGEFVVRVPPGPAQYSATAHASGFQSQRKSVMVQDQERVEVTFQLERESK